MSPIWPAVGLGVFALGCADLPSAAPEQLNDPGPRDGSFDSALSFDGIDDYATTGTARFPIINRPQTQSLRVWLDEPSSGRQALLTLRLNKESGTVLGLDRGVPLLFNVWGDKELARGDRALSRARWYHLAAVLDEKGGHLYVDGKWVASGPMPETNRTPTLAFLGSIDGTEQLFRGQLDDVRVYDRALVEDEVASEALGTPSEGPLPLVLDLPFDENAGARAYDRSGLGNHAELGDGIPEFMPRRVPSAPQPEP